MHEIQRKILGWVTQKGIGATTLREIGSAIGVSHPQKVKYHLDQLSRAGEVFVAKKGGKIVSISPKVDSVGGLGLLNIPIYGSANCGPATLVAEANFEGYLKVSESFLRGYSDRFFALRAVGSSMNSANIHGESVEDGDYVIVDGSARAAMDSDYVVSIIDGCANIKKLLKEPDRVVLLSESTEDIPPIFIHKNDDFLINGKVVKVIKKPKGGGWE